MIGFLMALAVHTSDIDQVWTNNSKEEVKALEMEATFYTADCVGCLGITKTGQDVRNTIYDNNKRIVAVDPNVIPLESIVEVELENGESFEAIAGDIGGKIKGNRIDVLVSNNEEALHLGRQKAKVNIKEDNNG